METRPYQRLRRRKRWMVPPGVPLAIRQLRLTWRLLLFIAVSITLTVIMVCMVPLYSRVTEAASLRDTLLATPTSRLITATETTHRASKLDYTQTSNLISYSFTHYVSHYMETPLKSQMIINQVLLDQSSYPSHIPNVLVNLVGTPDGDATGHLQLTSGRFPQTTDGTYEVALTQAEANQLGVNVGSQMNLSWAYFDSVAGGHVDFQPVPITVVGIFALPRYDSDPYWNTLAFDTGSIQLGNAIPPADFQVLPILTSTGSLFNEIEHLRGKTVDRNGNVPSSLELPYQISTSWHTYLDVDKLGIEQLDDGIAKIDDLQSDILDFAVVVATQGVNLTVTGDTVGDGSSLKVYQNRQGVSEAPLIIFLIAIIGLVLLFVGVMTDLLVNRQTNAIVVLRSRGASRGDIFAALSLQSLAIGVIAILAGPILAIEAVIALAERTIQSQDLPVLLPLQNNPIHAAMGIGVYAVLLVVATLLTMVFSIWQIARSDILTLRRESARSTKGSLWQRLNLDIIAIVAAFVAYGVTTYINYSGILNTSTSVELALLVVIAPFCLLIAMTLLFLRLLPVLIHGMQLLAARGRAAVAMIAVTQVARAPRQIIRMILLLALATAMIIFSQVFTASQNQHIYDVAAYQTEADLSGTITSSLAPNKAPPYSTLKDWLKSYYKVPGVQAASVGYRGTFDDDQSGQTIEIQAVDADTFAQAAIWPRNNGAKNLAGMMQTLATLRKNAIANNFVPAYVDASLWNALKLKSNHLFTLRTLSDPTNGGYTFLAVGEIQHLPPIADSVDVPSTGDYTSGGMIIDYQTVEPISAKAAVASGLPSPFMINNAWLKTSDDGKTLAAIHTRLSKGDLQLSNIRDRRAIISTLHIDPPYLAIVQVLQIGAIVAFILTIVGSLISSWLNVTSRLTNLALLRALGARRTQLARIFLWEQGIVYVAAVALGLFLGLLLGITIVPPLVFTSGAAITGPRILTTAEFYAIQRTPPVYVNTPPSLVFGLIVIGLVCFIAIWLMTQAASRLSIGQTLRLNED